MANPWTRNDPRWQSLDAYHRAALMSLMEADGANPQSARNALSAMINRAAKSKEDLGEHVSKPIYQPTIEPAQQARLDRLMKSVAYENLADWGKRRAAGQEADPVSGATHFLAPESTMLKLEASNPSKYKNWGPRGANWTGYDPGTGSYKGVITRDGSHAFLAPEGAFSAGGEAGPQAVASAAPPPILQGGYGRESGPAVASAAPPTPGPSPDAATAPGPMAQFKSWSNKPLFNMPEALGGKPITPGSLGKGLGSVLSAMGGGDGDKQAAQLTAEAQRANASALSEEEKRQAQALQSVLARRKPRGAFA